MERASFENSGSEVKFANGGWKSLLEFDGIRSEMSWAVWGNGAFWLGKRRKETAFFNEKYIKMELVVSNTCNSYRVKPP